MRTRALGATGIRVSDIGFGAWGIGGSTEHAAAYGLTDDRQSLRALEVAVEQGVTFFDTADFYGFGRSERLIGHALSGVREKVVIASKVGMSGAGGAQNFSPAHIRRSVELSLQRLRTDYIDLYQLHSPPLELLEHGGAALDELAALRDEGKIRAIGVSLRAPDDGLAALRMPGLRCLQVNFNMTDQRALDCRLFEACERSGAGVVVRTPLCFGFLTGKLSGDATFGPTDHRARWGRGQIERWATAPQRFSSILNAYPNDTPAQIALRYCLSFTCVSTVIPGMLTEEHVMENVKASELGALNRLELDEIRKVYLGHEFFERRNAIDAREPER